MLAVLLFSFFHAVIGSDYANAKADLSLRWAHASEGTFSHDAGITKVMYGGKQKSQNTCGALSYLFPCYAVH